MVTIELSFPAGRYHATPWDHHVNEGVIEWPPSPWRLLRALIAVRFRKDEREISEGELRGIVEALAARPPDYHLPRAATSHLRHYMPGYAAKKKSADYQTPNTTKVFDTFLHLLPGERMQVSWPAVELSADQRALLRHLLDQLGYLGRAESWVEARLLEDDDPLLEINVMAKEGDGLRRAGQETVRVLAPLSPDEYLRWRGAALDERLTRALDDKRRKAASKGKDPDRIKLSPKERQAAAGAISETLFEALFADTSDLKQQGWNQPPGGRWIDYHRPTSIFCRVPTSSRSRPTAQMSVARFAVASQVPKRLTEAYLFADWMKVALCSLSDGAPVFSGHAPDNQPLRGHDHAFILPEAAARHGRISHVTVYAKGGLGQERAVLDRLHRLDRKSERYPTQLVLLSVGAPGDFAPHRRDADGEQCPFFACSRVWVSRTPFISTRHPKTRRTGERKLDEDGRWIGSPEHDLVRLLAEAGFPQPREIAELRQTHFDDRPVRWLEFKTHRRRGHGRRASGRGFGFRLTFDQPVVGPIVLGFGAHLGLGQFVPEGFYAAESS